MKTLKLLLTLTFSVAFALGVMTAMHGCRKETASLQSIAFESDKYYVNVKSKTSIFVSGSPAGFVPSEIIWTNGDDGVLTLMESTYSFPEGIIAGIKVLPKNVGTSEVSVVIDGLRASCTVTVADATMSFGTISTVANRTISIPFTVFPDSPDVRSQVTWKSWQPEIAEVDNGGNVTGKSNGTANIVAELFGQTYPCSVIVSDFASQVVEANATSSSCDLQCSFMADFSCDERGMCWCTEDRNPTVEDNRTVAGKGDEGFTVTVPGLDEHTTYFVRPYCIGKGKTYYGNRCRFCTAKEWWKYVDEYGIERWGVEVGGHVWAPVPCGYNEKTYPHGKLYQLGRPVGHEGGEITWNDPADHTKGGHFTDNDGTQVTVVFGMGTVDDIKRKDLFFVNDVDYFIKEAPADNDKITKEDREQMDNWVASYAMNENGLVYFGRLTNPCPEGYYVDELAMAGLVDTKVHYADGFKVFSDCDYSECPQGVRFETECGRFRAPDGKMETTGAFLYWDRSQDSGSKQPEAYGRYDFMRIAAPAAGNVSSYWTRNGNCAFSVRCVIP